MRRIVRSDRAIADVLAISEYIAARNQPAAERWLDEIDRRLALIVSQPLIGESVEHLEHGVRRQTFGNYLLYYVPIEGGIELRRVLHAARKIEDLR
jgi:plasmid stabilization system protein ParE